MNKKYRLFSCTGIKYKPYLTIRCNGLVYIQDWIVGNWSLCSSLCGPGLMVNMMPLKFLV